VPIVRDSGGGRINVVRLGGRRFAGGLYSASKFALEGLSDALRMELAPFNIKLASLSQAQSAPIFYRRCPKQSQSN